MISRASQKLNGELPTLSPMHDTELEDELYGTFIRMRSLLEQQPPTEENDSQQVSMPASVGRCRPGVGIFPRLGLFSGET